MSRSGARLELPLLVLVVTVAVSELALALAWGPSNLTARVIDGDDGFNSLEITWDPGQCGQLDDSTITIIRDNVARDQMMKTARGLATFDNCEYWSRYEVTLRSGLACLDTELRVFIKTGPGQPHRPIDFEVTPRETSADFAIVEAFMPREVSGYDLQLCRTDVDATDGCKPQTFLNHTATDGFQHGAFVDLEPESSYDYKVIPIIIDGSKSFRGFPLTGSFRTTQIEFPMLRSPNAKYEEKNSTLSAAFTWEAIRPDFAVKSYWITIEPCEEDCTRAIDTPAANFTNLEFSSNTRLGVSALFVVGGQIRIKKFIFNITTPNHIAPIEALEIAKISPTEAVFRLAPTERPSEYEIAICDATECVHRRQEIPEVHLISHKPGTLYDVEIKVHQDNFTAEYFKGPLQMLKNDYGIPEILSLGAEDRRWDRVIYTIQAIIDEDASFLEVEACISSGDRDDCSHVKVENTEEDVVKSARLSLNYFTSYEVVATVVYELPLGKEVRKSSTRTITTVGTDPEPVENIVAPDITADSIHLQWKPPKNIPDPTQGALTISYEIKTESGSWSTSEPTLRVSYLSPYTEYVFSIRAVVTYLEESFVRYEGEAAQATFRTDAGKPRKVENLRIHQRAHSPTVNLTWDPPLDTHSEIQFYVVDYGSFDDDVVEQREHVYSTETTLTLPVTQNDIPYFFRAAAVTYNSLQDALVGEFTEVNVTVPGIGVTFNISLIGRTSNSLQLLLEPSEDGNNPEGLFFTVTDYENLGPVTKGTSGIVNVTGLSSYDYVLLIIHACYEDDFCTEGKLFGAATEVDAPSAVDWLQATVWNRTNVHLYWLPPVTKNGPIDGYSVEVVDETDSAAEVDTTVTSVLRFNYNSSDEFETIRISVTAFNNQINDTSKKFFGPTKTVSVRTSGFSWPKVENLRIIDADAREVTLMWEQPETDLHFIVDSYSSIWEKGDRGGKIFYKVGFIDSEFPQLITQNLSATISGMEPFRNFSLGVKTCSRINDAMTCGLPRKVYGRTDAAPPSEPRNLTIRVIDESTAIFTWEPPESPNGEIAGYALSIENSTSTFISNLNEAIHNVHDLNPSETYHLTVVAFNFDKHRQRLESKPATAEFSTGHSSSAMPLVLIFGAILLALGGTIIGLWWYRRKRAVPYEPIGEDQ